MDPGVEGLGLESDSGPDRGDMPTERYQIGDCSEAQRNTQGDKPQDILCLQQVIISPFLLPTQRNVSFYVWLFK